MVLPGILYTTNQSDGKTIYLPRYLGTLLTSTKPPRHLPLRLRRLILNRLIELVDALARLGRRVLADSVQSVDARLRVGASFDASVFGLLFRNISYGRVMSCVENTISRKQGIATLT